MKQLATHEAQGLRVPSFAQRRGETNTSFSPKPEPQWVCFLQLVCVLDIACKPKGEQSDTYLLETAPVTLTWEPPFLDEVEPS